MGRIPITNPYGWIPTYILTYIWRFPKIAVPPNHPNHIHYSKYILVLKAVMTWGSPILRNPRFKKHHFKNSPDIFTYIYIYIYTYIYIFVCIYVYIYTYVYIYIYMYKDISIQFLGSSCFDPRPSGKTTPGLVRRPFRDRPSA